MYHPRRSPRSANPGASTLSSTRAFALNCASSIVKPYASQLFHPIGGVGAMEPAGCAAAGDTIVKARAMAETGQDRSRVRMPSALVFFPYVLLRRSSGPAAHAVQVVMTYPSGRFCEAA